MRGNTSKLILTTASLALCVLLMTTATSHASEQVVRALPSTCEQPAAAPKSVRDAYEEYYACVEPIIAPWLSAHPEEVAELQRAYDLWQEARGDDLRGQPAAARWVRRHPVRFSTSDVSLTAAQIEDLSPNEGADPVKVAGTFERLFVDRDNRRLFLTTREEGLLSIAIAERYAFTLEGAVGKGGARDFFIYDATTAFVEEPGQNGRDRDLVVLDISNPSTPIEVKRLHGVLPEMRVWRRFRDRMKDAPPTFEQYRLIREGRLITSCDPPRAVSTRPDYRCRPDGTCHRNTCARTNENAIAAPNLGSRQVDGFGRGTSSAGGTGGAGSLSQMMVYDKTLYVLSSSPNYDQGWLMTFDLTSPHDPRLRHITQLDNGPEALRLHDNLLLVAGRRSVVTASVAEPNRPRLLGEFRQQCPVNYDPIVVEGHFGYRTIIAAGQGGDCTSRLEVIDLSKPHVPTLQTTVPLERPRGLSVLGTRLFVADERRGVRLFDIADPGAPVEVGLWRLPMVKDLVLSDFDLYAMTSNKIETFFVAPLFEADASLAEAHGKISGHLTVVNTSKPAEPPRNTRSVRVVPEGLQVRGSLAPDVVERIARRNRRDLEQCYIEELHQISELAGRVSIRFVIAANGSVVSALISETSLNRPNMERCLTDRIRRWQFPEPESSEFVVVRYTFDFWP